MLSYFNVSLVGHIRQVWLCIADKYENFTINSKINKQTNTAVKHVNFSNVSGVKPLINFFKVFY